MHDASAENASGSQDKLLSLARECGATCKETSPHTTTSALRIAFWGDQLAALEQRIRQDERERAGWVSISERVPERDRMRCAVIAPQAVHGDLWPTEWDADNQSFSAAFGWFELDEVTHWMPLPLPPIRSGASHG